MQLQFSNSNNSSSTGSHYYSGTYARRTLQAHQVQPLSSSSSSSAYQLLQHPMIVQSRSTDSQLDVDSYNFYSNGESMKRKDHDNTSLSHKSSVTVPSFFNRTHPVLLNESSESSSSSSSSVTMIQQSKENIDCRISVAPSTKTTEKENKLTVANLRRRRSQNIFTPTPRVITTSDTNGDESDNDTDDDDDDDQNFAKRSKWDVEMYNTHDNGLWIQRSYAFDDDSDDDADDDRLDENVEVTVNIPIDFHQSWMTEPLVR